MKNDLFGFFQLTPNETKIFNNILKEGAKTLPDLKQKMKMQPSSLELGVNNLISKGLLRKIEKQKKIYYSSETKDNIIRSLRQKKIELQEEIDKQINLLEIMGDELALRHHARSLPKITFYEGTAGLEKAYEDTLTATEPIKSWASFEGMHGALPEYFKHYYERRAGNGIFIRSIHPDSKLARERQKNDFKEMRESFLVDQKKFQWIPEIQMYDNKVNISSWKEKLGIIIESEEIYQALSTIFEMSLETARRYDEEVQKGYWQEKD